MKRLLLSALGILAIGTAQAQLRYTFNTQTGQSYTPLTTGATNLTAGVQWDDNEYSAPIGFTFQFNGQTITTVDVISLPGLIMVGRLNSTQDTATGFLAIDADLHDRGNAGTGTAALSPIRYSTTGSSPSRIFKVEFANAGFYDDNNDTDSANFQVWMYEGTNAVELRYGPSRVTLANNYFFSATGPAPGFVKDLDYNNGNFGKVYYLRGAINAPSLDSTSIPNFPSTALTGYPASGTVYRFTPSTTDIDLNQAAAAARALKIYPTTATAAVTVEWNGTDGEAYQILSATGQQVAAGRLQRGTQSISVSALAAGAYHLRLAAGSHSFVKK